MKLIYYNFVLEMKLKENLQETRENFDIKFKHKFKVSIAYHVSL